MIGTSALFPSSHNTISDSMTDGVVKTTGRTTAAVEAKFV